LQPFCSNLTQFIRKKNKKSARQLLLLEIAKPLSSLRDAELRDIPHANPQLNSTLTFNLAIFLEFTKKSIINMI